MDELHLKDPEHNPTSSEFLLERSDAKENEPCSTEMGQSSIVETHATQFEIPTNPVFESKEIILVGDSKWNDILAYKFFRGDTLRNWSLDWYVILLKMNEKLTVQFIGIRWVQNCEKQVRRVEGKNSRTQIGFNTFMKQAERGGSSIPLIPKKYCCTFVPFKDSLVGIWSA